jgi:hypothetical protein
MLGSPNLEVIGRAASSPDNAQATHFFLINDDGTYFLRRLDSPPPLIDADGRFDAKRLVAAAEQCKVRLGPRLEFPRQYPAYLGRNRYVSNIPGSTMLVPVLDLTRQYINGMMYLLSQPDGQRPTFIDDWNFYRKAGVAKWVRSGFLNPKNPIPLGVTGTFRIHIEADLLLQNLLLTIQALGLGGWVHASFLPPLLLGDPEYASLGAGLRFRFHQPAWSLGRWLRKPITPLPAWRPNPVGIDNVLQGYCPPNYNSMAEAIDALLATKYGPKGHYNDLPLWEGIFKPGFAGNFLEEVPRYSDDVIACAKDVCTYIYDTYGRFPAHVDAMHVPGVWVQAHHVDLDYYDKLFRHGLSETQRAHQQRWHSDGASNK